MPDSRLTGWEHRKLRHALTSAFDGDGLQRMVSERLDIKMQSVVSLAAPFDAVTFDLVAWAERRGMLFRLFEAASEENPDNETLRQAVAEVFHVDRRHEQLQALVNATGGVGGNFVDPAVWRDDFARSELAICRIENGEGRPWGSGWLIAKDLILTNRHVWTEALKDGRTVGSARAAFNYRVLPGGGEAFAKRFAFAHPEPIISESPVEQLDFVLLRLDRTVAGAPVADYPGAPLVNPLKPRTHAFAGREPAIIVQHPNGALMKFAWGLIADAAAQTLPNRVVYEIDTEPGSSGSPVFLTDWQPVALHSQRHDDDGANAGVRMSELLPVIAPHIA